MAVWATTRSGALRLWPRAAEGTPVGTSSTTVPGADQVTLDEQEVVRQFEDLFNLQFVTGVKQDQRAAEVRAAADRAGFHPLRVKELEERAGRRSMWRSVW